MNLKDMTTFVVTFAQVGIRDGWVEITAYRADIARSWAKREYGSCWSGFYRLDEWTDDDRAMYRLGRIGQVTLQHERPLADHDDGQAWSSR